MARKGRGIPAKPIIIIGALTGNQSITSGDTATFTEQTAAFPGTEVLPVSDTADVIDDDLSIDIPKSSSDTASIVDAVTDRDFSQGDVLSLREEPLGGDTGTFSEAVPSLGNNILGADTGIGVDAVLLINPSDTDTGTGSEAVKDRQFTQKDTSGATTEVGVVGSATPTAGDTGHFTETINNVDRGGSLIRTYNVPPDPRVLTIPNGARVYTVPNENRTKVVTA